MATMCDGKVERFFLGSRSRTYICAPPRPAYKRGTTQTEPGDASAG